MNKTAILMCIIFGFIAAAGCQKKNPTETSSQPAASATITGTAQSTSSRTATPTLTVTSTDTATPTFTGTLTETSTDTGTETVTPTATETDTATMTCTITVSPTNTCVPSTWYRDQDNDGYGVSGTTTQACTKPAGYAALSGDCNDLNALLNPGAAEACDGLDNDCDGMVDEGITSPVGMCGTLGECALVVAVCTGNGGWICQYPVTHEDVETSCSDGLDNDCDGLIDSADPDCP